MPSFEREDVGVSVIEEKSKTLEVRRKPYVSRETRSAASLPSSLLSHLLYITFLLY
jgi:hypothetical protein